MFSLELSRKLTSPEKGTKLLIIGNGMVGLHFCKSLVKRGLQKKFNIRVVGAESVPAYDRIHLSSYVKTREAKSLILENESWYGDNGIELVLGQSINSIDLKKKEAISEGDNTFAYDYLVFATGSRAFAPPIDGIDHKNVILYRNITDIQKIVKVAEGKKHGTIIGGGLLGLEAAQALQELKLQSSVIHLGGHLMSSQLTPMAAKPLQNQVEAQGIEVLLSGNTKKVAEQNDRLKVSLADGRDIDSDLVIVAAGIRPNTEIAEEAGIACGVRGGIIVNSHLETEVDNVFAVGECALLEGKTFGLAAPGYAMADHLAARLAGEKLDPLPTPDMSTKLKMVGVDVTTIGDALEEGVMLEFQSDDHYRSLTLSPKGELRGALGIGTWEESARIQELFKENAILTQKERDYFVKEGVLSAGGGESSVQQWPDKRIVCNCMGISKGEIIECFKTCGQDPDKIAAQTSCSEVCGSCRPLLEELCNKPPSAAPKPVAVKRLLVISGVAIIGVLAILIAPPAPIADSVQSWYYKVDKLWRSSVTKQITGYTLMGIFLLGMLISLRKRFRWFRFGHFNKWRVFHSAFGVVSLVALFFHTGFHFGENLNYWLMLCFVLINILGGVAGIFSALESSGTSALALKARRFRPALVYLHIILFWPLPVLLAFHIASVYLY